MVKVKICGITNLDDALAAVEYGADALGFVFAPSPRQVTAEVVRKIVEKLPPFICKVGVFVNSDLALVRETMSLCNLDLAQLHGDEGPEYCAALFPKVFKVFHSNSMPSRTELIRYKVAAYMLDIDKGAASNESEQKKLWQLAHRLGDYGPVILAGGLTSDNVSLAIKIARPYAVDVSSGVETEPGKKDHDKMHAFVSATKSVDLYIRQTIGIATATSIAPVGADQCVCPQNRQLQEAANSAFKSRRSIRLKEYDYSQAGAYFLTICTQNRELLLEHATAKTIVQKWWDKLPTKFPEIQTDQFVIMPNHMHGIIFITPEGQSHGTAPTSDKGEPMCSPLRKLTLGKIVQWFKTMTTNEYIKSVRTRSIKPFQEKLWQRNYYEHVIRNENDLDSVRKYIVDNPSKWEEDEYNPGNFAQGAKGKVIANRKRKYG
jgi:phosphoribosylanthranilate isomerase